MDKLASRKWLKQAADDLNWTQSNIREKIWYGACFTAQQAAEKALKAYLIYCGKSITKIHDLGALLEMCVKIDKSFEELREASASLTGYYTPTRYPDVAEFMIFSKNKAEEALELAQEILRFVEGKIK